MKNKNENNVVLGRLQKAVRHFYIFRQKSLVFTRRSKYRIAVKNQVPFILFKPNCSAAKNLRTITGYILEKFDEGVPTVENKKFIEKFKNFLLRK